MEAADRSARLVGRLGAVLGSGLVLLLGRVGNAGALIAANALLARVLSVPEMGQFLAFFNFSLIAGIAAGLGLGDYLVREVAAERSLAATPVSRTMTAGASAFLLGLPPMLVSIAGLCALVPDVIGVERLEPLTAVSLLLLTTAFAARLVVAGALRGLGTTWQAALADGTAANLVFLLVVAVIWAAGGTLDIARLLIGYAALNAVITAASWLLVRPVMRPRAVPAARLVTILRASAVLMLPALTGALSVQITVLVVAAVGAPHEVAYAGVALQVANAIGLVAMAAHLAAAPELAQLEARGNRAEMARLCRSLSLIASLPIAPFLVVVLVAGAAVCGLAFGPSYGAAAFPLAIYCTARFLEIAQGPAHTVLMMTGRGAICAVVQAGGLVVGAVLMVLAYELHGFHAAVVISGLVTVLQRTVLVFEVQRRLGFSTTFLTARLPGVGRPVEPRR